MATIRPFKAIHPNPFYADHLVFANPQTESVAGNSAGQEGLPPLKHLLETSARQRPETTAGQELAYMEINATLAQLLQSEKLYPDQEPAIYIYEIGHHNYSQTGIWALTGLNDPIKTHELTFTDSVRRISNYRTHTSLEGSPILLTYAPDAAIDQMVAAVKSEPAHTIYKSLSGSHQLWKITDPRIVNCLIQTFSVIKKVYLADGHHRLESALLIKDIYPWISALYMSTDELRIRPYNRVVIPDKPMAKETLFKSLLADFYIQETYNNRPVDPTKERRMGLNFGGEWFHIVAKPHTYIQGTTTDRLDVSILQDRVFSLIFGINDPANDQRLKHVGGGKAMQEMECILRAHPSSIGFTLCPITTRQLIAAADEGINLPPKSSWIDPKVPYGLLLHRH